MTDFNNFNYREINATQSNFIGFVSNGKIYNSFNQQIGVTNDEYKKAIDTAKDYEQILYDKGILEKPKTPEEMSKETQKVLKDTQAMMLEMSNALAALNDKVVKLEEKESNAKQTANTERSEPLFKTRKSPDVKPELEKKFITEVKLSNKCIPWDKEQAEYAVKNMRNKDGTTGEHWSYAQTSDVMSKKGYDFNPAEWFYVLNMVYSDHYSQDFPVDTYVKLACDILTDVDAPKNATKKTYIAKHY